MEPLRNIIKNTFDITKEKNPPTVREIFCVFKDVIETDKDFKKLTGSVKPSKFKKGKLLISADNHAVVQEFLTLKPRIALKINEILNQKIVQDIQIKV